MKKTIFSLLAVALACSSFATGISGPTVVFVGNSYTYVYYGHQVLQPKWSASLGTILSFDEAEAVVYWTGAGSTTLALRDMSTGGTTVATLAIAVSPVPVATGATDFSSTGFTAHWGSVPGATSYLLDVSLNNTFTNLVTGYNNLSVSGTSQVIGNLSAGTNYYYRVKAFNNNGGGTSLPSNTISTITVPPVPSAPVYITKSSPTSFTATWNASKGATGYYFEYWPQYGSKISITLGVVTSKTISGIAVCPDIWYYHVRAFNSSGSSLYSSYTGAGPYKSPGEWYPTCYAATELLSTGFTAHWDEGISCTPTWRFILSTDRSLSYRIIDTYLSGTSLLVSGLGARPERTFYYAVVNSADHVSPVISVTIPQFKSTAEISEMEEANPDAVLSLYPNPVRERLFLKGSVSGKAEIWIYSMDGVLIKQVSQSIENGIDVSDLRPGNYLIRIANGNNPVKLSFIKE